MAQLTSPLKLLLVSQPVCVEPFFSPPTVPDLKFPACWDKKRWVRTHFVGYLRKSIRVWESCIAPSRWQLGPATFKWPVILPIHGDPSVEYYHFVCITLINPQVCHQFSFRIIADSPLANQTCLYQAAHPGIATPRENSGISMPLVLRHHQADKESEMSQMIGK